MTKFFLRALPCFALIVLGAHARPLHRAATIHRRTCHPRRRRRHRRLRRSLRCRSHRQAPRANSRHGHGRRRSRLPSGAAQQFANCYDKTWGRLKSRTRPSPGNHEFHSSGAAPYFDYFGAVAGDPKKGYYSYELGAWHIIVLNSECGELGGCGVGSPQEKWLRADLAAHPVACTLAYWHKPLFSSGAKHGNDPEIKPLWQALYEANADVVVNGHDHDYERFAPQNPDGVRDPARGIREFVVGTGGKNTRAFAKIESTSEAHETGTFGILKLTLHSNSYDWEFIPIPGKTFRDSGTGTCH